MIYNTYKYLPKPIQQLLVNSFRSIQKASYFVSSNYKQPGTLKSETIKKYNLQRTYGPRKRLCYAPYSSMFFSREGYMSPCYATYNKNSDKWPEKTISEAWFNGENKKIRAQMSINNLNYSCNFCQTMFESNNFGTLLTNKYEVYSIKSQVYPQIMEFELSNNCNLECIMCDGNLSSSIRKNRDKKDSLPMVYTEKFIEELKPFIQHLHMAEFTGGDPFLIPMYYEIWNLINTINPKCQILITTNANTMSDKIEWLLANYNNIHFNISIDSLNKENYEKIRINATFDFVLKNIYKVINYCKKNKTTCNILVCPMTINCYDFTDLIKFANENNICLHFHTLVKPKHLSLKYQTSDFLIALINYLEKYIPPTLTKNQIINASNYQSLIKLITTWKDENLKNEHHFIEITSDKQYLSIAQNHLSVKSYNRLKTITSKFQNHPQSINIYTFLLQLDFSEIENILITETDETIYSKINEILNKK